MMDCCRFVEEIFPAAQRHSSLARMAGLNVSVGLDVSGPKGGRWTCAWINGELSGVARDG